MRRVTRLWPLVGLVLVAGCGRALAWDTFTRSVSNGWGAASPLGGQWVQVKGSPSNLSVNGSSGVFSITAGNYLSVEQIAILPSASTRDFLGTFVVGFGENVNSFNGLHGGVVAYLVARYQNTSATGYYRLGLVWDGPTHQLWLRTQNAAGKGKPSDWTIEQQTGIDPTSDYPGGGPYWYQVKVQISGSTPTTFASKAWKLGTNEPAAWMLTGSDANNFGPQGAGPLGVRASNDLQGSSGYINYDAHVFVNNMAVGSLPS